MTGNSSERRQTMADLMAFHEIARALTSSLDLESILSTIMRQMQRFFHPETWALLLTDDPQKDLYYAIADGRFGPRLADVRVPYGRGMAGWVAEHGQTLVLPQATEETATDPYLGFEVRSAVCIPLRSRFRTLGVIQLFNLPPENFSEYAISFLLVLCDFAAIAIENARAFERVQELTIVDECTGLYNLRHFQNVLKTEVTRCERLGVPMSLIFIDLDHFKLVNDQFGHQVGSRLLAEVSATIKSQIRSIDLAFRYGGDEFLVLLPGAPLQKAVQVANRLIFAFRKKRHTLSPSLQLNVRASLGVASYPEDSRDGQELLRIADARMYLVKGTTRDGVAFADTEHSLEKPA
jgi:diguanylate cyclase (GGDEF)-like protein